MRTHRFGQKLKLPSTRAIKHQILKLTLEDYLRAQDPGKTLIEGVGVEGHGLQKSAHALAKTADVEGHGFGDEIARQATH